MMLRSKREKARGAGRLGRGGDGGFKSERLTVPEARRRMQREPHTDLWPRLPGVERQSPHDDRSFSLEHSEPARFPPAEVSQLQRGLSGRCVCVQARVYVYTYVRVCVCVRMRV